MQNAIQSNPTKYPHVHVQLTGNNGNAFCILGLCQHYRQERTHPGRPDGLPRFAFSPDTSTESTLPPRCRRWVSCRVVLVGQRRISIRRKKSPP